MEAGAFDNLPSKGKPILLDQDAFEDPDLRMAHHLLRVNGFAPPWIEEAREIEHVSRVLRIDLEDARRNHAVTSPSWQRALDGFRSDARQLNSRILTYNLKSPSPQFHKLPLDIEAEIRAVLTLKRQ